MSLTAKLIAMGALIAALFTGYLGIKHIGIVQGRAEIQAKWDKDKIARSDAMLDAINKRNADNAQLLEEQRKINETIVKGKQDELTQVRASLASSERLRLGKAWCDGGRPASATQAASASGSNDANSTSRLLPESVDRDIRALILQTEETAATGRAAQAFIRQNGLAP